jgi:hypothetical protein
VIVQGLFKKEVITLVWSIVFLSFIQWVHAEDLSSLKEEIEVLKQRVIYLEEKLRQYEERGKETEEVAKKDVADTFEGISIGASLTYVLQGTHNANADSLSEGGEDTIDASYSIDLEFQKEFDNNASGFIHLETGAGRGVEDELKVFSNVNRDADDSDNSVSLTEAWYQYRHASWVFTFGKIDPTVYIDNNEYANDECTQFLGRIFRNSPAIEFPDNSGGLYVGFRPYQFMDLDLVILDADSDWENFFDSIFVATQVSFKPRFRGREGNWRIIAWLNDRDHTKWAEPTKQEQEGWGMGISLDQEITETVGVFLRYGWQDPEVYLSGQDFSLERAWSVGVQFSGSLWGRAEDIFAVAFGQIIPSDDYKDANNLRAKSEEHLEAYYSFKMGNHLTLSPDIHLIWDPYGGDAVNGDDTIVVGGLRVQVNF